jgi:hypothetical protein
MDTKCASVSRIFYAWAYQNIIKGEAFLTVGYAIFGNKGWSPFNGRLSDFSFYIDSQIVHRKFKK